MSRCRRWTLEQFGLGSECYPDKGKNEHRCQHELAKKQLG